MDSLETRREKLNLTFAKKCLKIERMKHLFPLNSKNLKMKIRDSLKQEVIKAKKERYKKSSVISMQKLLNLKKPFISCKQGTVHKLVPNP